MNIKEEIYDIRGGIALLILWAAIKVCPGRDEDSLFILLDWIERAQGEDGSKPAEK